MRNVWLAVVLGIGGACRGPDIDPGSPRVVQISAGMSSTCVLTDSGGVRCWGENFNGEGILGYGTKEHVGDDEVPASMGDLKLGGSVGYVSVGSREACAVLESKTVRCWGDGSSNVGDDETPDSVPPVGWVTASATTVEVGWGRICAVMVEGGLQCNLPFPKLAGPVESASAGSSHVCVVLNDGDVQCWGKIGGGVLGYPGVDFIFGPDIEDYDLGIVDVGEPVVQVVTASTHTCALMESGNVRCWGLNFDSLLGYGTGIGDACGVIDELSGHDGRDCDDQPDCCVGDDEPPSAWPPVDLGGGRVLELSASIHHTCAVMEGGTVRCWGHNEVGQLGYPGLTEDIGDDESAGALGDVPLDHKVVHVAAGSRHTCALTEEGEVYCWGYNGTRGYLGQGVSKLGCIDEKGAASCALPECCLGDDEPIDSFPPVQVF